MVKVSVLTGKMYLYMIINMIWVVIELNITIIYMVSELNVNMIRVVSKLDMHMVIKLIIDLICGIYWVEYG